LQKLEGLLQCALLGLKPYFLCLFTLHSGELATKTKSPMLSIRDAAWASLVTTSAGTGICAAFAIPPPKVAEAATATAVANVRIVESLMLLSKKLQNYLQSARDDSCFFPKVEISINIIRIFCKVVNPPRVRIVVAPIEPRTWGRR